jgi:hypothetical protein
MSTRDTESVSRRRMPLQEIVKWWGIGGLIAGAILGVVRVFLNIDGYALLRNFGDVYPLLMPAAYCFMAAIGAVAASIPAMLIGLIGGLCLRLIRRAPTTYSKPASEMVSDARNRVGIGCLSSVLGSLIGFGGGLPIDLSESRRMAAEGLTVDFLPVMMLGGPFVGAALGAALAGAVMWRSRPQEGQNG